MDMLRDPLWQFVGAILALLGVAAAIAIYFVQRQKKQLSYRTDTNASLVSVRDEASSRITVAYDGTRVSNVRLFEITFTNTGNVPICSSDYERPVSLDFLESARVLSAEIVEQIPANLGVCVSFSATQVKVAPILMNRGDSFTIKATVSDSSGHYRPDARIVGVARLSPLDERRRIIDPIGLFAGMLSGMVTSFVALTALTKKSPSAAMWAVTGLTVVALAVAVLKTRRGHRRSKRSRTTGSSVS